MSGPPKRLHDEGNHSTPAKRPLEGTSIYSNHFSIGKPIQSVSSEYHQPLEQGQDGRSAKFQRIESHDGDKRTPAMHRMSSSSNGSCLDHPIAPESRTDTRESKDTRDVKAESREAKGEIGVTRPDIRSDDKEIRLDRDSQTDNKGENNAYDPHINWRHKEQHKGKAYDVSEAWSASRRNFRNTDEMAKEGSNVEERDTLEAREAVGENKVEEKFKDKERKRKDWVERDKDINDRRNNLQLGSTSSDRKDLSREERDVERLERERKDRRDREKEPMKKETLNGSEMEISQNETELDASALDAKRSSESWKVGDKDFKDKKREKDIDVEGDKTDRRGKCYGKESDDGYMEVDGVAEKDREMFNCGVQQRKRMLRPRGTPQSGQRDARFRSRSCDNEGSQGKSEVSAVVYKVGECMHELLKSWKEYEESLDNKTDEKLQNGPTLEIRIPAEHVTATNRQVRGGQLWGTDIYTHDSDLVAVLMHTGYCRPSSSPPPGAIQELKATIRVLPPQNCYTSTLRNNVRSRAWGAAIGCSYRVEHCCIVKKGGGTIDLEPRLMHISALEPTLAPVAVERTMTTRAAASNALRQQKFVREVTIQYNLCNEPWVKYSISIVADKGLKKPLFTSARLKKGEVLYLESHTRRYELCFTGEKVLSNGTATTSHAPESEQEKHHHHGSHAPMSERNLMERNNIVDMFRWSRCQKPLPQKMMRSIGIPLPVEHLEVLEENLNWEDIQWSQTGVWVAGKEYFLARVHFLSPN
ncbi:hypothetical protein QJS10_CPB13g00891 [Acorus calamus]|uniref:Histone deacetylation protein Rxt3 n=1 Tax=Acorus calamus TaxID=4465 RepID=A0AAV9DI84_ACOCL|nr:hypothetical protein QJS10_CPB13g00891 [Acorus calamus]